MSSPLCEFRSLGHETPRVDLDVLRAICREVVAGTVVDVGSWVGMSALEFLKEADTVHCIDHFLGNENDRLGELAVRHGSEHIFRTFCENMGSDLFRRVFPHVGESLFYASVWTIPADLVFIDAEHTYEACRDDTAAWWPHVKRGGVMVWHDYGVFKGVTRAVDEFGKDSRKGNVAWKFKP